MTTQSQPGPELFVFGVERSTSTSSPPEKQQTFFDCLEEQAQTQGTSTNPTSPEDRPARSKAARTLDRPFATTVNKFDRIANIMEPFNIIGPSTGSGTVPSDSEAATKPSERPGGLFGLFGVHRPSTPPISKHPSSDSGTAAPTLFSHPPYTQTPGGLFSAPAIKNKQEHQGADSGQPNKRGSPGKCRKNPPSIFDVPPPQPENTSSSLFGNLQSNYGKAPSAPSEATLLFGHAPAAPASSGLFAASTPTQTSGGLFSASTPLNKNEDHDAVSRQPDTRGPPAQSKKDPPSIFDLPAPQTGNPSSSLFGNPRPPTQGGAPAPFEGASFFGGARPLFGHPRPAQASGGLFPASATVNKQEHQGEGLVQPNGHGPSAQSANVSSSIFDGITRPQSGNTSSSLFGNPPPNHVPGGGLFGGINPYPVPSKGLFGSDNPTPGRGGLFGSDNTTPGRGGLFGSDNTIPVPGKGLFGSDNTIADRGGLFGSLSYDEYKALASSEQQAKIVNGPSNNQPPTDDEKFREGNAAQKIETNQAGALPKLLGQDLQTKADDAWTQQQSKIQLALSSIQDAQAHGQEAHNSFRQERDHWQDQIKHLEKKLEEKQSRIVAMSEEIQQANEQANKQILEMRRYYSASGRLPPGNLNPDEWFFDCAANRKFGAMYTCLRQLFSREQHPKDFLDRINPEDVWYDPFNLCLKREVFLKDGYIYLRRSEGPSAAQDSAGSLAGPQVEKNQTQITDTFKPNLPPGASLSDNKKKSDTSNVVSEPGNGSKAKPAKDTMDKTIKGRHGRIMFLGPSASQTEGIPSLAKQSEASQTESTKPAAGLTPTDENKNHLKPTPIRSRSDSTPLPIRGKRSSPARPISKDENNNDPAKQTSTPAIRPLIKEEWLTNEQRVSRIRKEEDETVERAMLRKRQQKGQ